MPKKVVHYDDPAYDYQKYWDGRQYEHEAEKMALHKLLEGKHFQSAVDIGGGYGRISLLLKKYADKVILIEPSRQQLKLADEFLADHPDIERRRLYGDALNFPDASVDLVTMIRVMHHLPDPSSEFAEIARILSDEGYAIIEAANYMHARNRIKYLIHHKKLPLSPVDIRSLHNRHADEIPFVNHNPKTIRRQLAHAGLKVERILSVSNLRSSGVKKLVPRRVMLAIEGILQPTLAQGFFGPSVFFLVRKIK